MRGLDDSGDRRDEAGSLICSGFDDIDLLNFNN